MMRSPEGAPSPAMRWPFLLLLCGAFSVAVIGAKFVLVGGWGSEIPFWDQWDGLGERIIIAEAKGDLTAGTFFEPHNEHRIAFTRLLFLALVKANGQWDARLEMTVNAFLHAAALTVLLLLGMRTLTRTAAIVFASFAALASALPIGLENTLAGFQSQFYFVLGFAFAHIGGAAFAPPGSRRWWAGHAAGTAGLFAMASGFVSAVVVIGATIARCVAERRRATPLEKLGAAWAAVLIVCGVLLRADVPTHAALHAASLIEWAHAFAWLTAWPVPSVWGSAATLFPVGWAIHQAWRTRFQHRGYTVSAALGAWWLLQTGLLAYGRGGENLGLSPRYFDLLVIGTLIGALAWLHLLAQAARDSRHRRIWVTVGAVAWGGCIAFGLQHQSVAQLKFLRDLPAVNAAREAAIGGFVSGKIATLETKQPWFDLPYPNYQALETWLRNPAIRSLLPPSVRAPLRLTPATSATFEAEAPSSLPSTVPTWSSYARREAPGNWSSQPLATQFPLLRFQVAGDLMPPDGRVAVVHDAGEQLVQPRNARRATWGRVAIEVPRHRPFHVEAFSAAGHWVAFSEPVEVGWLSWGAAQVLPLGWNLLGTGGAILVGMVFLAFRPEGRPPMRFWTCWLIGGLALPLAVIDPRPLAEQAPQLPPGSATAWFTGDFVPGGVFPTTATGRLLPGLRHVGSWIGTDQWQGEVTSAWFPPTARRLQVFVAGYPQHPACSLTLAVRHRDGTVSEIACALGSPGEHWERWEVGLPADVVEVQLRAVDHATNNQGWLGVSEPVSAPHPAAAWLMLSQIITALALVASVTWAPALLRYARAGRQHRGTFEAPAGNLGVIVGLGLVVGIASVFLPPQPLVIAVAGGLWLAAGARAWRHRVRDTPPERA